MMQEQRGHIRSKILLFRIASICLISYHLTTLIKQIEHPWLPPHSRSNIYTLHMVEFSLQFTTKQSWLSNIDLERTSKPVTSKMVIRSNMPRHHTRCVLYHCQRMIILSPVTLLSREETNHSHQMNEVSSSNNILPTADLRIVRFVEYILQQSRHIPFKFHRMYTQSNNQSSSNPVFSHTLSKRTYIPS